MSTTYEAQLIAETRQKDSAALSRLLEFYRPRILGIIERQMSAKLKQKTDPEDIAQEVMISCLQALPSVNLEDLQPFDWICQMIHRRVVDAGRKYSGTEKRDLRREVPLAGGPNESGGLVNLLVASMTTASMAFSRNQKEIQMAAALQELSPESQTALRLRYIEGLPSKEIAERMQKTDGAVRVLLTRSIQRLQRALEGRSDTHT